MRTGRSVVFGHMHIMQLHIQQARVVRLLAAVDNGAYLGTSLDGKLAPTGTLQP